MKLSKIAYNIKLLREQLSNLPEYIYHVSPYTNEIIKYGALVPSGMGDGSDFCR